MVLYAFYFTPLLLWQYIVCCYFQIIFYTFPVSENCEAWFDQVLQFCFVGEVQYIVFYSICNVSTFSSCILICFLLCQTCGLLMYMNQAVYLAPDQKVPAHCTLLIKWSECLQTSSVNHSEVLQPQAQCSIDKGHTIDILVTREREGVKRRGTYIIVISCYVVVNFSQGCRLIKFIFMFLRGGKENW